MNSGRVLWRIIALVYWAAMAVGSHWPRLDISEQFGLEESYFSLGVDKWVHSLAYAGLAFLALLAAPFRGSLKRQITLTLIAGFLYTIVDELSQSLVAGRESSFNDLFASSLGLILGVGAFLVVRWLLGGERGLEDFVGHARLVSALTLVSRVLGLLRDRALAWAFGFTPAMDGFNIAFLIPNLFRRLFGEGALAAAFIPQYTRLLDRDRAVADADPGSPPPRSAANLLYLVLAGLAGLLGSICVVGILILFILLGGGVLDDRGALTAKLTIVTLWYAPLVCLSAVLAAALQVHKRFAIPALSPVVLNVTLIAATLVAVWSLGGAGVEVQLLFVALAVVVAGLLQVMVHYIALKPHSRPIYSGASLRQTWQGDTEARLGARRLLSQWAPTVIGLAVFQINILFDSLIAFFLSAPPGQTLHLFGRAVAYPMREGDVSILAMTQRLYEFPLGVFAIAVATAIFPRLAESATEPERFGRLLRAGIRLTIFIALPASIGLLLVRHPLSAVVYYPGGEIQMDDPARIAMVLAAYAPAVWAYSMNHLLVRAFYALHAAATTMRVAVGMVGLNLTLNLILIWPLGAAGLAAATTLTAVVQCVILALLLRRRGVQLTDPGLRRSVILAVLLTLAMAGFVYLLVPPGDLAALSFVRVAAVLAAAAGLGAGLYLAGAKLLRMSELRWLISGRLD